MVSSALAQNENKVQQATIYKHFMNVVQRFSFFLFCDGYPIL